MNERLAVCHAAKVDSGSSGSGSGTSNGTAHTFLSHTKMMTMTFSHGIYYMLSVSCLVSLQKIRSVSVWLQLSWILLKCWLRTALSQVQLTRTTATDKPVHEMVHTLKERIYHNLCHFPFSVDMDESTSNNKEVLAILVLYLNQKTKTIDIEKEVLPMTNDLVKLSNY